MSGARPPGLRLGRLAALVAIALGWAIPASAVQAPATRPIAAPSRVVSLVPAVTEMLFAMGAGDRVVGVSSFDNFPAEARTRPRVGALIDPDLERIFSLKPDLVVLYATQDDLKVQLARAGVPMFEYRHGGLADVAATVRRIGSAVGAAARADDLARLIEQRIEVVRRRVAGRARPRALLVFGRQPFTLRNLYASGGTGFLHDMLVACGADNVFADVARESIQATSETLLVRRPEVIVELHYTRAMTPGDLERERAAWQALPSLPAVKRGQVVLLVGDEFVVPGPRVADAVEKLAAALHPGGFGK